MKKILKSIEVTLNWTPDQGFKSHEYQPLLASITILDSPSTQHSSLLNMIS